MIFRCVSLNGSFKANFANRTFYKWTNTVMKNRIPMELHFKNTKKVFLVLGVILGSKNVEFGMKV